MFYCDFAELSTYRTKKYDETHGDKLRIVLGQGIYWLLKGSLWATSKEIVLFGAKMWSLTEYCDTTF